MRGLLGKKIGMTRIFDDFGNMIPVTVLEAGPCVVTLMKSSGVDGYDAVQVGYLEKKPKHLSKALERINDGTFGICKICGELIPEERMMEVPNATKCVQCKENEKLNI